MYANVRSRRLPLVSTRTRDDADARAIARHRGLVVVGTLGVLLRAKRAGHVDLIAPIMAKMAELGMFVADSLMNEILLAAGESGTSR